MTLSSRVAIVTGAARGIGKSIADRLANDGATVVSGDVDVEPVADEAASNGGVAIAVDVSDPEQVSALTDRVMERFGRIDILVNNAGVYPETPWDDLDFAEWRRVLGINLDGVFLMSKAVYAPMRAAGYGRIVNMASDLLVSPPPSMTHYVASKGGVFGFTRGLAREVGVHGITVNAVAPGLIDTETVRDNIPPEIIDIIVGTQAIPRIGEPDDVASAVAFLASEDAGWITGSMLAVGGGKCLH